MNRVQPIRGALSVRETARSPRATPRSGVAALPRGTKTKRRPAAREETPAEYAVHVGMPADEVQVIAQAEAILRAKFERLGDALTGPSAVSAFLRMRLAGLAHEEFHAIWLDTRHRPISVERLFIGSIDGATIHPREVVRAALKHNAAAVIFAHNHPSGIPEPSKADQLITTRLCNTLDLIEVRVLDHFVIGGLSVPVSMAARGMI